MNSTVQSLPPSWLRPGTHGLPHPVHAGTESGALTRSPEAEATTVADNDPADAVTRTWLGVSPVAHTHVSRPTTVAPETPSPVVTLGFVSTSGTGIRTAPIAARTRVRASITGAGGSPPAGTQI